MFLKSNNLIINLLLVVVASTSLSNVALAQSRESLTQSGGASAQSTRALSVAELFELGITHSLQVQSAQMELQRSSSNLLDKKSDRFADVNVGAVGGYAGDPTVFKSGLSGATRSSSVNWSQNYSIDLHQPLYQGGRIKYAADKAALQKRIAELSLERDISQIKLLLMGKYLDLLNLYKQQEVIQTSITQAQQRLHDIRGMERNGMVTLSDVLRSELQLSNYQLALTETRNNITILSIELDVALGLDEQLVLLPDSSLLEDKTMLLPCQTYLVGAYERYPELKMAQTYTEIAQSDLQATKANYLPKLAVQASNMLARPITSVSPAQDLYANRWNVSLSLSYNLSSLYRNRHKINMSHASVNLQQIDQQRIMQDVRTAVKSSYIKHNESLERIRTLAISVEQAAENYRIVLNKYQNHIAILTDLLDASALQLDAQLQLTTAKTNAVYTYYQLLRSSGNL